MFKARGTRIIAGVPRSNTEPGEVPARAPEPQEPEINGAKPLNGNASAETFGLPALPSDFLDQVRAARAGDADAVAVMHDIGAMVPEHLRVSFMAYVQDMLDEIDARA